MIVLRCRCKTFVAPRAGAWIEMINIYRALNQIGRDKLTDYAVDLSESGRYRKDTDCGQMG